VWGSHWRRTSGGVGSGESAANQTSSMRVPKRKLLGYLPHLFDAVVDIEQQRCRYDRPAAADQSQGKPDESATESGREGPMWGKPRHSPLRI
jgi:hypothetical protein